MAGASFWMPKLPSRIGIASGLVVAMALAVSACSSPAANSGGSTSTQNLSPAQLINTGLSALHAGNTEVARQDFNEVLTEDPDNKYGDNKIAYFDLGVIDQSAGNLAGSEAEYNEALKLDPTYSLALYNLAVELAVKQPAEAISLYQRVLAIEPNYVAAVYNLGLLLYQQGQIAEGQSYLSRAISADPSYRKLLPAGVTP
jgi:Tfp pilus assembly protein PilF